MTHFSPIFITMVSLQSRINLSPFTKDFRAVEQSISLQTNFFSPMKIGYHKVTRMSNNSRYVQFLRLLIYIVMFDIIMLDTQIKYHECDGFF